MRYLEIIENSSVTLSDEDTLAFTEFIKSNNNLPVQLNGNFLSFEEYTVGSITVSDLSITIIPRNSLLNPNHFFEMELYNEGLLNSSLSALLDENRSFGIQQNLVKIFLSEMSKLVEYGLEGRFINVIEETNVLKGKILTSLITPINLMQDFIPVEYTEHTRDVYFNKILKLALFKILSLLETKDNIVKYSIISSYLTDIDVVPSEANELISKVKNYQYFDNPHYHTAIGLALKILEELKINMKNSKILGSAYLVNSNNLFEMYVRNILDRNLKLSISKWDSPKQLGQFTFNDLDFVKSYVPDILVDYKSDTNSALVVLDAKNKDVSNPQNIGNVSDLYQILFYCHSLNSRYGGLVYPYYGQFKPTKLVITSFKETSLYAFGIDFSLPIMERHTNFVKQITTTFHIQ